MTSSLKPYMLFIFRRLTKVCKLHIDKVCGFHRLTERLRTEKTYSSGNIWTGVTRSNTRLQKAS
jgi:hypothetical protein